jgi:hypothetical protein
MANSCRDYPPESKQSMMVATQPFWRLRVPRESRKLDTGQKLTIIEYPERDRDNRLIHSSISDGA